MSNAHGKEFILTDYAKNLIEFKARQLSRRRGLGQADRDEIQQELWLAVVNQADRFDPARASLDTFIDRVVNTAAAMILRDRERQKRANGFRAVSLDAVSNDDDRSKQSLAAKITEDDLYRRLGAKHRDEIADREQADAVATALRLMPPEVNDVWRRVMGGSISSAAAELKTSRRQCELRGQQHDYESVVIDSLDWLERLVWDKLCAESNVNSIEKVDGGYSKGYTHALTYWREIIDQLNALRNSRGMVVVLIAHSKVERFEDPESSPYDRYSPPAKPTATTSSRSSQAKSYF